MNKEIKKMMALSLLSGIFISGFAIYGYWNNKINSDISSQNEFVLYEIGCNIGEGFVIYNDEIYYKNPNLCLWNENSVGSLADTVDTKIVYDDIKEQKNVEIEKDMAAAYGIEEKTPFYFHKERDDVLLFPSDYQSFEYNIYVKNVLKEEYMPSYIQEIKGNSFALYDKKLDVILKGSLESISQISLEDERLQQPMELVLLVAESNNIGIKYYAYIDENDNIFTSDDKNIYQVIYERGDAS